MKPQRRRRRRAGAGSRRPPPRRRRRTRRWRTRHVVAVLSAPLVLIAGGGFAYFGLARPASVEVPNVVHRDVFTAASTLQEGRIRSRQHRRRQPATGRRRARAAPAARRRPTRARPSRSRSATSSPPCPTWSAHPSTTRSPSLRRVGFVDLPVVDDYRDDVDPGHRRRRHAVRVLRSGEDGPGLASRSCARSARDGPQRGRARPGDRHGESPAARPRGRGEEREQPHRRRRHRDQPEPGRRHVLVRGDTVTLTVSTGSEAREGAVRRRVVVDDAYGRARRRRLRGGDRHDAGATARSARSWPRTRPGGQAPEGSTVTITVGVRQNGRASFASLIFRLGKLSAVTLSPPSPHRRATAVDGPWPRKRWPPGCASPTPGSPAGCARRR